MVALRAAGYKHGRTEFYAAEPRRIMEVTMADIKQITPENFDATVNGSLPVLVDFWAPWCGPCKMVAPIIEELAAEFEGQVIIGKCDVDDNSDVAAEYGIRNIPTVLFFKNGEIVDKQVGAVAKPVFVEKVKNLL